MTISLRLVAQTSAALAVAATLTGCAAGSLGAEGAAQGGKQGALGGAVAGAVGSIFWGGNGVQNMATTAVVGAALQTGLEQCCRQESAQQTLTLGVVEGLPGLLVFDEFDSVEVPGPANVADDGEVIEFVQRGVECSLVVAHVLVETLAFKDVEVCE